MKTVAFPNMGTKNSVVDRFREYVRSERDRRGWSQAEMAKHLRSAGLEYMIPSTVAKIEIGERSVRIEEACTYADVFSAPIDVMFGRGDRGVDAVWAASKLSTNAQKSVAELMAMRDRLADDTRDLVTYSTSDGRFDVLQNLAESAAAAAKSIDDAATAVGKLATEFPMPGVSFDR